MKKEEKEIIVCFCYCVDGYMPASKFFDSEEKAKKWVEEKRKNSDSQKH
jgi:hypothetical protein